MNKLLMSQLGDLIVGDESSWKIKIHPKKLNYIEHYHLPPQPVYPIVTLEYFNHFYNPGDYKVLRIDLDTNYIYVREM